MRTKEEVLKLFEDNQKLVRFIYNKHFKFVSVEDGDDLIQEGMIGLYQAAKSFDETKNIKFSSYASKAIFYSMLQYKERYLQKHSEVWSLNWQCEANENVEKFEFIEDTSVDFSEIETKELIDKVLKDASKKEKVTLKLRLEGKTQREIASVLKVTQAEISRVCSMLANDIRKIQGGEPITPRKVIRAKVEHERANMLRSEVCKLRTNGATYDEIVEKLNIPKGSISFYLRAS